MIVQWRPLLAGRACDERGQIVTRSDLGQGLGDVAVILVEHDSYAPAPHVW